MVKSNQKSWSVADVIAAGEESSAGLIGLLEEAGPGAISVVVQVVNECKMAADMAEKIDMPGLATSTAAQLVGVALLVRELKQRYEAKHGSVDWDVEIEKFKAERRAKSPTTSHERN